MRTLPGWLFLLSIALGGDAIADVRKFSIPLTKDLDEGLSELAKPRYDLSHQVIIELDDLPPPEGLKGELLVFLNTEEGDFTASNPGFVGSFSYFGNGEPYGLQLDIRTTVRKLLDVGRISFGNFRPLIITFFYDNPSSKVDLSRVKVSYRADPIIRKQETIQPI